MAQYYTLEEAANKLNLSVDDFRRKIQTEWKHLRRFPDTSTIRFLTKEIDEEARRAFGHSEPELVIGDVPHDLPDPNADFGAGLLDLVDDPDPTPVQAELAGPTAKPTEMQDLGQMIPLMADEASVVSGPIQKKAGDSDVRIEAADPLPRSLTDSSAEHYTEEILELPRPAEPAKPKFEVSSDPDIALPSAPPKPRVTSEFELSLDDSDSDEFDLNLSDDGSDEVDLGSMRVSRKSLMGEDSGINLQSPADSGISLEDDQPFDLNPAHLETQEHVPGNDDDSEFELTIDDPAVVAGGSQQKDIFETDFELPALEDDSSSEAVNLKETGDTDLESSDFDLDIDDSSVEVEEESASEVVAIEDELEVEDDLEEPELDADEDEDEYPAEPSGRSEPAEWGVLPVIFMAPTVLVMFFVGLMGLELVQGMWAYTHGSKATGLITKSVAGLFGDLPKD